LGLETGHMRSWHSSLGRFVQSGELPCAIVGVSPICRELDSQQRE
jgi:hypothetical protein